MQAKVQKLCKDWSIPPKANQSNRKWADVMADMKTKMFENASTYFRERSAGVIDLTSGPPAKRQRLLLERGMLECRVSASIAISSSWADAGAGRLPWQTIMQRVHQELRRMVWTGPLELHVESMDPLFKKRSLLRIVPCTAKTLKKKLLRGEYVSACGALRPSSGIYLDFGFVSYVASLRVLKQVAQVLPPLSSFNNKSYPSLAALQQWFEPIAQQLPMPFGLLQARRRKEKCLELMHVYHGALSPSSSSRT